MNETSRKIHISEIFGPVLQGEGALIGRPTVFVRTGGCDYRCVWCDTLYAVLPEFRHEWEPLTPQQIIERVFELSGGHSILVTLSGGNPALAPLEELLVLGKKRGLNFALETQGSVAKPWFRLLEHLILSPKGPSSGMATDMGKLDECIESARKATHYSLKIVVFDEEDYHFAHRIADLYPSLKMYLQVGSPNLNACSTSEEVTSQIAARASWLLSRVMQDGWAEVTILPQLHVLLWGGGRGV